MSRTVWQDDGANQISTTGDDLKLVVRRFDRCARYIVLEQTRGNDDPGLMLASGTADSMDAAMLGAIRSAARLRPVLHERRRKRAGGA